jgi:hypothetical protein
LSGNGGSGVEGVQGCGRTGNAGSSTLDGGSGVNGENGKIDDNNANIKGGNGGVGGIGGNGGQGGNGSDGIAVDIYWSGIGTSPIAMDSIFDLAGQSVIQVNNVGQIGQAVEFTDVSLPIGAGITNWNFDLTSNWANPAVSNDNPSTTQYTRPGRYSIRHNTTGAALAVYKGFFGIPVGFNLVSTTTASSSVVSGDGTATVNPQSSGVYTYQWDANTGNQTSSTAVNLVPGTYCVTVTDGNSCLNVTCVTVLLNTSTYSIHNQEKLLRLYPNPSGNHCTLSIKKVEGIKELKVVNALGQLKYQTTFDETTYLLHVEEWTKGLYYLELKTENGLRWVRKLVVQD